MPKLSSKTSYACAKVLKLSVKTKAVAFILYHSGVARVKKKLMRGYVQIWCDLRTIFDICEDLTRSVDISRPAPENSLALFYDNPRKLYLDSRQLALYNIVMKKRKKFDIQEWLKHNEDKHEQCRPITNCDVSINLY